MRKVGLLTLGAFALGLDAYVMAGLLPVTADDLGTRVSLAGQLVTVFTLAYALAAPLVAGLLSGVRPRALILAALAVFTLGNAATALAPSLGTLLGPCRRGCRCRGLLGAVHGGGCRDGGARAARPGAGPGDGRDERGHRTGRTARAAARRARRLADHDVAADGARRGRARRAGGAAAAGPGRAAVPVQARLAALTDRAVAPVVGVSFLAAVASLGLYTYLAPVLAAAGGVGEVAPYLWAWGAGGVLGSVLAGPLVDRTGRVRLLAAGSSR